MLAKESKKETRYSPSPQAFTREAIAGATMVRYQLAATLLLATYLMVPPPRLVGDQFQIDFAAPLSEWDQLRLFNSDAECEAALKSYR